MRESLLKRWGVGRWTLGHWTGMYLVAGGTVLTVPCVEVPGDEDCCPGIVHFCWVTPEPDLRGPRFILPYSIDLSVDIYFELLEMYYTIDTSYAFYIENYSSNLLFLRS